MTSRLKPILVLLILSISNDIILCQSTWIKQTSPTTKFLSDVFFVNNNTGWISGDSGVILNTTDRGVNWVIQNSNTYNTLTDIFFINERIGWALAWVIVPDSNAFLGTLLLKTSDGGLNWQQVAFQYPNIFLKSIYFLDSLTGYTGGAPGGIYKSEDGGNRWDLTRIDSTSLAVLPVESINFLNALTGYACGGFRDYAGSMWKTTDGGSLWTITLVGPEPVNDLYINNPSNIISVGGDFEYGSSYVKTTNAGTNWIYDTLGVFGVARSIDYRTPDEAWISVGDKFCMTTDGGITFTSFYTTDSLRLDDLCFTDSLSGWAVGNFGTILKYIYNSTGIVEISSLNIPDNFTLFQNYPNPFNPNTKIKFELKNNSTVSLKIYDILGNEIADLINDDIKNELTAGTYEVDFSGNGLPSGVYFYELVVSSPREEGSPNSLNTPNYSQVKKMLLLK